MTQRIPNYLIGLLVVMLFTVTSAKAQFYSVSVNTPALATATLNTEVSMTLNRWWSLHGDLSVHPWRIEQFRIQHLLVRPQVRWWVTESYRGWFLGAHGLFAGYHIGIPKWMPRKVKGIAYGGGLDFGYAWALSPEWNIEAQIGGSYVYADYDLLENCNCGDLVDSEKRGLFLPTKLALSVIYLF